MKEKKIHLIIRNMTRQGRDFFLGLLVYGLWSMVYSPAHAQAAGVVIKIRAINPLEEKTAVSIRYPLPQGITPGDIVAQRMKSNTRPAATEGEDSTAAVPAVQETNLRIKYDKEKKYYFVDHKMTLAPKEIVTFEVEVRDVWVVPSGEMETLRKEIDVLVERSPDLDETAALLQQGILDALTQVETSQASDTAAKVGVENHIKAYEKNAERLSQARMDVKMLKNLLKRPKEKKKMEEGR